MGPMDPKPAHRIYSVEIRLQFTNTGEGGILKCLRAPALGQALQGTQMRPPWWAECLATQPTHSGAKAEPEEDHFFGVSSRLSQAGTTPPGGRGMCTPTGKYPEGLCLKAWPGKCPIQKSRWVCMRVLCLERKKKSATNKA